MHSRDHSAKPSDEADQPGHSDSHSDKRLLPLAVGAIGVVFGDIGTSPLYAFREALAQASADGLLAEEVLGVVSLMLWALMLIVTVKYVMFLMRADNDGEGGVLALLALARGGNGGGRSGRIALALGAIGAALFYGDAIITPALSVLSAVEGLRTVPGLAPVFTAPRILGLSMAILIALFAIQSRGTGAVSRLFGPVCIVWFIAIAGIGCLHIADAPGVFAALLPSHAVGFVADHGVVGLFVLGAVFLTVTGAEALTADMGHFGKTPIRLGWLCLVFPALILNYLGQGAFAISVLAQTEAQGTALASHDWFFEMIPAILRIPMVMLATAATIIASQAVITGAYSLTQQAIQLGMLPRMRVQQTSAGHAGQIYIPAINWFLLAGVIGLALAFRNSSDMAAAYGIAVTGTMVATSCLAFLVLRRRWGWSLPASVAMIAPFLAIDLMFFGANILRVVEGGWVPLMIGAALLLIIAVWIKGRRLVGIVEDDDAVPLDQMALALSRRPPTRIKGIAVFLTARNELTPHALLHNMKHNHVLHERNYIATVRTMSRPWVDPGNRLVIERVDDNFARLELRYGFMQTPDVYHDLIAAKAQLPGAANASFFIGHNNYVPVPDCGMPVWQDFLFIFLHRNAANPTAYYRIPPNRVIELGAQYAI